MSLGGPNHTTCTGTFMDGGNPEGSTTEKGKLCTPGGTFPPKEARCRSYPRNSMSSLITLWSVIGATPLAVGTTPVVFVIVRVLVRPTTRSTRASADSPASFCKTASADSVVGLEGDCPRAVESVALRVCVCPAYARDCEDSERRNGT